MKRTFIALALMLCTAAFANAQGGRMGGTPAERAERQITSLASLNLTADQKAKLTDVFLWQGKQIDSLRNAAGGFEGMREKMAPVQTETTRRVNLVLNADQQKAYQAILEERRARMRN